MAKKETVLSVLREIRDLLKARLIVHGEGVFSVSKDNRFIRNADGTVTDNQRKLVWYPTMDKKYTWEEAKRECEKMGCRLPTSHELYSLVDVGRYSPAIDKEIFPDTKIDDWYWSSTPCAWDSGLAWCVVFRYGSVHYGSKGSYGYVRPVRSSQ
jgi:hypothetical protein